jgi:hypothetical protein
MALFVLLALFCPDQKPLAGLALATSSSVMVSPLATPPVESGVLTSPLPAPPPELSPQARIALDYIATHKKISPADLLVVHEHPRSYSLLDRRFIAFTIFDRMERRSFHLLVGLDDNAVVEEVEAVERAEAEARRTRYRKLHPLLYERLQTVGENETLPVAIWVEGERGRSREEVYAVLASRYPEVRDALARGASLFEVNDPLLAQQLRVEYEQMRQADVAVRVQPLASHLENQGAVVETHYLLPSVTVTLSKDAILALAERDDVQTIYLVEGEEELVLDTAVSTDRVAPVWSRLGIDGLPEPTLPITIAVVEQGNVDWDNSFLHHMPFRLLGVSGEQNHATRVASAAASFHEAYRGLAPGATILSAGTDGTMSGAHFSLNWALDQDVDVVNYSAGWFNDIPELEWLCRAFDHTARDRSATIVTVAGNYRDRHIGTPGKGWNVITVGGINDQGTAFWADDAMYLGEGNRGSSYLDPDSPHGDREKPEVTAPGKISAP